MTTFFSLPSSPPSPTSIHSFPTKPSPAKRVLSSSWEHLGPRNLFDDKTHRGEAGTLADAASPASNPKLIYTGGSNNGASSGILKSTDMGVTWARASKGLFDSRIHAVFLHPADPTGGHVLAGTSTGIYESLDGAGSWSRIPASVNFGLVYSLANGTINGKAYVLAGCQHGIATNPVDGSGNWSSMIPYPDAVLPFAGTVHGFSVASDGAGGNTAVGACMRANRTDAAFAGNGYIGAITSPTSCDWKLTATPIVCAKLALHPFNKDHFIYTNATWGKCA